MPVIKLALAGGLIYWLVQSGKFNLEELKKINSLTVWGSGILMFMMVLLVNTKRWQTLLSFESIQISYKEAFRLSIMGIFFNFFMPGGVGGDVVKAGYLMGQVGQKKWFIGWSILVDRVLGLLALMLYSGITGLLFYKQLPETYQMAFFTLSLLIVVGFLVLVAFLIVSPKNRIDQLLKSHPLAEKVLHPLFYFFSQPRKIVLPFALSFVSQGIVISMGIFLLTYLNAGLPPWMILLIFPFGFMATVLPISPAGLGVGQAAFYYLFKEIANNGEYGVLVITFFQAVQFLIGLLGGLVFVLYKKQEA